MPTPTRSVKLDEDRLPPELRLPTDYPLKETLGIYAKRLGILLTGSVMIFGIGTLGVWFSTLLAPILYLTSSKVRATVHRRLKDSLLSSVVILLGLLLSSILELGFFGTVFFYALILGVVIFIFTRK